MVVTMCTLCINRGVKGCSDDCSSQESSACRNENHRRIVSILFDKKHSCIFVFLFFNLVESISELVLPSPTSHADWAICHTQNPCRGKACQPGLDSFDSINPSFNAEACRLPVEHNLVGSDRETKIPVQFLVNREKVLSVLGPFGHFLKALVPLDNFSKLDRRRALKAKVIYFVP
jgi:hypothetical protein